MKTFWRAFAALMTLLLIVLPGGYVFIKRGVTIWGTYGDCSGEACWSVYAQCCLKNDLLFMSPFLLGALACGVVAAISRKW